MNRWIKRLALAFFFFAAGAQAQENVIRDAPKDVVRGMLAVSATPPVITVDGKDDRFSPGARIRDTRNMLVLSGTLIGQTHPMVYRRDAAGMVHEVWLLTADEYAKLGGGDGSQDGHKRLAELLDLIWAARWLLLRH